MPKPPLDGEKPMINMTIRISKDMLDDLKRIAKAHKRTHSDLVRIVLTDYIETNKEVK